MFDLGTMLSDIIGIKQAQKQNTLGQMEYQAGVTDQLQQSGMDQIAQTGQLLTERTAITEQKAALDLQRAMVGEEAQRIIGLDPAQLNNEFVQSIAEMNAAEERRKVARAEYDQLAGATLLNDPLGWLAAQVSLPEIANRVNAAADERDAAIQNLNTRHSLLQTQKSVVTAATAQQAKELQLREAQIAEKNSRIQLLAAESKLTADVAARRLNESNLTDKALQTEASKLDAMLSVEDLMSRREERAAARMERAEAGRLRLAALLEKESDKEAAEALEAQYDINLQRAAATLGIAPGLTFKQLDKLPLPRIQKEVLANVALTGQLGASPEEVLKVFNTFSSAMPYLQQNNPLLARTVQNTQTAVESYAQSLMGRPGPDGKPVPAKKAVEQAFQTFEDEVYKSANLRNFTKPMNHPAWDNQFNPYKINHKLILELANNGSAKFLADNMYTKALQGVSAFVPPERESFRGEDENKALLTMVEHVKRRDMLPKDAARQISDYYKAAKMIQADQTQYGILQLPLPQRYHVTMPASGMFGSPQTVDLLNPAEVEKMLLSQVRAENVGIFNTLLRGAIPPGPALLFESTIGRQPGTQRLIDQVFEEERGTARPAQ